jgi:hypothetical protein
MVDGARGGGELEAALVALVEVAIGADLASFLVALSLGNERSYPQGFTG